MYQGVIQIICEILTWVPILCILLILINVFIQLSLSVLMDPMYHSHHRKSRELTYNILGKQASWAKIGNFFSLFCIHTESKTGVIQGVGGLFQGLTPRKVNGCYFFPKFKQSGSKNKIVICFFFFILQTRERKGKKTMAFTELFLLADVSIPSMTFPGFSH